MLDPSAENWSLCVGRWRGVGVRLHVLLPLLALSLMALEGVERSIAFKAFLVLIASIVLQELVRAIAAFRVGGYVQSVVIGPIGGFTKLHVPADPPAHLVAAVVGPMTFFVVLVVASVGLFLSGDSSVPFILSAPNALPVDVMDSALTKIHVIGQLAVWINWCLLLLSLLPMDPCAGAELLRGVLWPIVGRSTAATATSHVALGGALFFGLLGLVMVQQDLGAGLVPSWLLCAGLSVLLFYSGCRSTQVRRYDLGLPFDEFDSDDSNWFGQESEEEDREVVLVEHLHDRQQEALDRKRREREAHEDERVDAILALLRDSSFDQLSEEDRIVLKRASRRYRLRRNHSDENR
ncbi:MAG: hypothetical protein KDA57_09910 [Planctomycetales bacterium]|nr:hypothetical protein [Planctomycetales bacterium]